MKGNFYKSDLIQSQQAERRKIARDLHDGPAQTLASIIVMLDIITASGNKISEEAITDIKTMIKDTLAEIREIIFDLKPAFINKGLKGLLEDYYRKYEIRFGFHIKFIFSGIKGKYNDDLEIALFRIIQEAINNARKHSGVKEAVIKLEDSGDYLTLWITDHGVGINNNCLPGEGLGIIGMKERVQLIGGEIKISSADGTGTQILIKVPLEEGESNG